MIITSCDHPDLARFHEGDFCDRPTRFYALAAAVPECWGSDRYRASLAAYCSLDHAEQEPRPTLAAARATFTAVRENADADTVRLWEFVLGAFPAPVDGHRWHRLEELRERWRREPENRAEIEAMAKALTQQTH